MTKEQWKSSSTQKSQDHFYYFRTRDQTYYVIKFKSFELTNEGAPEKNVEKVTTDVLTTFGCLLLSTSGNLYVLNDNIVVVRPLIVKPIKMRV